MVGPPTAVAVAIPPSAAVAAATPLPPAVSPALAPSAAAVAVPMASWTPRPTLDEVGVRGWLKARFNELPVRPDRSATLRHEGGGRLDRLDLFLVVLLILGTMLLRTFRLAEPYQMHFDEVYHARTATEFLQAWRYGISHDIYEWTHPHVAKYLMAGGPGGVRERQGQCHERSRGPGRGRRRRAAPPGRDRSGRSRRRATARRHRDRDPDLRPRDPRPGLDRAGRGRHRTRDRRDRQPARHRLRRRTDRHARPRPDRWGRRRRGSSARPCRPGDRGPPGRPPPGHDRRDHARGRIVRPAHDHQPGRGDHPRHDRSAGHRRPRAGRDRAGPDRRGRHRDGCGGPCQERRPHPGDRCVGLRGADDGRRTRHDRRPRPSRQRQGADRPRRRDRRRHADRRRGRYAAADRGRDRRRSRVHRPRRRRAPVDHPARRRGARPGDGDRTRQPEAVCDVRRCGEAELRRHRRRWRPGQERPDGQGTRSRSPATAGARHLDRL